MMKLIPWGWRWVILAALSAALWGHGYTTGLTRESDRRDAQDLARLKTAVNLGNRLSGKLAQAETTIQIKTVERIKYVPQVTAGKPCLSAAAVSLLNGDDIHLLPATGQPAATDAGALAASDTDVEEWGVVANGQYETCAARLNTLIDYVEGKQ